ncbi:HAMP domain-containing protein [Paenibacillus hemerocallicola]|uniref:histidine kinase n=1 Tax=Paenibacillus hemerocallicola TaxID=1172614 RepID=A0A5C4TAM2_9BACL|nr:ATP-binding protein [Paenibacillus hemerocallicola]TNJ66031.1 HAMP domain-containing protein [Paenibacillus hemerocallicola]
MSVSRKIFIAMASFIVVMSVVFVLTTHLVVRESLGAIVESTKGEQMDALSARLAGYYKENGSSWGGVRQFVLHHDLLNADPNASIVLMSKDRDPMYADDKADYGLVKNLGFEREIQVDRQTIAYLYYYDPEAANLKKLQIGISVSVIFLLTASAVLFVLISLFIAYLISKWLTAPLRLLIPAIDRLGQGELGIQTPVASADEYGKFAIAFNDMSSRLRQGEDIRRNLVADVAHELRTPLTIVRGKLDLLQQSGQSIEPEGLLPLQDELIRLTRLVDDLHQLSLAEAKRLPLERRPTNMLELLRRIIDRISQDADDKQIDISLASEPESPTVYVDSNRMTQVFLNLLVNAIRYTPPGGKVNIAITREKGGKEADVLLRIAIADNGPGISPEHLPNLFNRFYRTDEARTRNSGGMGLGLSIAKQFVLAHEGTIDVQSIVGEGTTVIVTLPSTSQT